jgi:NitT/TauT family transport system permease protein
MADNDTRSANPTPRPVIADQSPAAAFARHEQPPAAATAPTRRARRGGQFFALRRETTTAQSLTCGGLCLAACLGLWWLATAGEPSQRWFSPTVLPSPRETLDSFPSLWFDRALTRNTWATLRRVGLGFGLATIVGVPLGVLCGCFSWAAAFFAPLTLFGRNIPVAALIPLTFSFFGIGELQKVMFIFIACVAFVVSDTAAAVAAVSSNYVDTAYTLGASRLQIILKVLFPLSLPAVFNSLRVLFGLAFGYIMLAELVKLGAESGGLGDIIITSQRRGPKEHIFLVLLLIPLVALAIDRGLFWIQRELFPHVYGGAGVLNRAVRTLLHGIEAFHRLLWRKPLPPQIAAELDRLGAP